MKDVLRQYDGQEDQTYTVHLVVQKATTNKVTSEQDTEHTDHPRITLAQIRLNIANGIQNQSQDINNVVMQHSPTQLYSTQQYFDPRNNQQMAWMQQAYTHYFTQYMQL